MLDATKNEFSSLILYDSMYVCMHCLVFPCMCNYTVIHYLDIYCETILCTCVFLQGWDILCLDGCIYYIMKMSFSFKPDIENNTTPEFCGLL